MAWERRANGKDYYYAANRVDGKVVKQYLGTGLKGFLGELAVRGRARIRKASLKARDDYLAEFWSLDHITRLASRSSKQALYVGYLLANWTRTKSHHWIKSKDSKLNVPTLAELSEKLSPPDDGECRQQAEPDSPPPADKEKPRYWPQSLEETIKLVMSGRRDLLGLLRSQLAEVPDLWQEVSDLTRIAIEGWARKISNGDPAFCESIVLATTAERETLLGECSTIMERAIVDHFVIAKLAHAYFNIVASTSDDTASHSKLGIAIEKKHRSAEFQFREATRQLNKIRAISDEIAPITPANVHAGVRLHDPESMLERKSA